MDHNGLPVWYPQSSPIHTGCDEASRRTFQMPQRTLLCGPANYASCICMNYNAAPNQSLHKFADVPSCPMGSHTSTTKCADPVPQHSHQTQITGLLPIDYSLSSAKLTYDPAPAQSPSAARRAAASARKRRQLEVETGDERRKRLDRHADVMFMSRIHESAKSTNERCQKMAAAARERRKAESPNTRKERLRKQATYQRQKRENETTAERNKRLDANHLCIYSRKYPAIKNPIKHLLHPRTKATMHLATEDEKKKY